MSHRQHQAGCPPTVQRGSGSSPRSRRKVERVPLGTESLAHLGKSNRLMLGVLVRHGAPAPCSRSERRMPWEPAPAAIGYPFGGTRIRAGFIPPRSGPRPAGRGRRETARRWRGDQSGGPPARSGPLGDLGNQGTVPPARSAWLPEQLPGKPRGPRRRRDRVPARRTRSRGAGHQA
jgi:hypothetical protein